MDDAELARRCAEKDEEAWEEFLRRCGPAARGMMRKTFRRAGLPEPAREAEEAMGSLSAALLENDGRALLAYRPPTPLRFYVALLARSTACRILRKRGREILLGDEEQEVEVPEAPPATAEEVHAALEALAPRERLVLRLFYWEGMRQDAIARALGVSPSGMGPLMTRAREAFRGNLERKSAESGPDRGP